MDWAAFEEEVNAQRDCGEVIVLGAPEGEWNWLSSGQPREDTFPLSREEAGRILTHLLTQDLAYDVPLLPAAKAAELAQTYLDAIHSGAHLYSNNDPAELASGRPLRGWTPIIEAATFDIGVYSLHADQRTVFWVLDED